VNKQELVTSVAEKSGLTKKDSEKAVNAVFASIEEALAKGDNWLVSELLKCAAVLPGKAATRKQAKKSRLQLPRCLPSKQVNLYAIPFNRLETITAPDLQVLNLQ